MLEKRPLEKLKRYSNILSRIGQFTDITESEIFEILDKNHDYLNSYNRELLILIENIYAIEELHKDLEREKTFENIKHNVLENIPSDILDKLIYYKEKNPRIYREFLLLLNNDEIEITENEIIYPKKGISILRKKIDFELNSLLKEKEKDKNNPSCSLPEPKIGLRFLEEINKIKNNLSDGYFIITKEHVEKLISDSDLADIIQTDEVLLSIFFLPRSNSNIILSTNTEEKSDNSSHFTSYEEYIDILNNGKSHRKKIDNNRRLEGNILIGRHI